MNNYIYIDFENLNNLKELKPIEGKYFVFIGSTQDKINSNLVIASNHCKIEWIRISGNGKNALDFHIVYYLSKNDTEKNCRHYILSKDTGFDPFIEHLKNKDIKIKRIITLDEVSDKSVINIKPEQNDYDLCNNNLQKIQKAKRPKTVKTLTSHFVAVMGKGKDNIVKSVIDEMFRKKIISLSENNRIKYI